VAAERHEAVEHVREVDPPKPSTKLTAMGDASAELARTRRISVGALRKALKNDLDWVVLKALEKERNRRYEPEGPGLKSWPPNSRYSRRIGSNAIAG
jgi:hypothetical protein